MHIQHTHTHSTAHTFTRNGSLPTFCQCFNFVHTWSVSTVKVNVITQLLLNGRISLIRSVHSPSANYTVDQPEEDNKQTEKKWHRNSKKLNKPSTLRWTTKRSHGKHHSTWSKQRAVSLGCTCLEVSALHCNIIMYSIFYFFFIVHQIPHNHNTTTTTTKTISVRSYTFEHQRNCICNVPGYHSILLKLEENND